MVKFICPKELTVFIEAFLVKEVVKLSKDTNIQTLAFNHYDNDMADEILELIQETDDGFIFDENDEIGEEPYGYVEDFFFGMLRILKMLKKEFSDVEIKGHVFMNFYGPYDCVFRARVETQSDESEVNFIDQRQCLVCHEWIDADKAWSLLGEEDFEYYDNFEGLDDQILLPSNYSVSGIKEEFCLCSEVCSAEWKQRFKEEY